MGDSHDHSFEAMADPLTIREGDERMGPGFSRGNVLYLETAADADRVIREDNIRGPVQCDYCGEDAELVKSSKVYGPGRNYGWMWVCWKCKAWVGCHDGTKNALGRLADSELRQAKMAAHAAFDPLWRDHPDPPWGRPGHRKSAYTWLADQLNLSPRHCHIGQMGVAMCQRVVAACQPYLNELEELDSDAADGEDMTWE